MKMFRILLLLVAAMFSIAGQKRSLKERVCHSPKIIVALINYSTLPLIQKYKNPLQKERA